MDRRRFLAVIGGAAFAGGCGASYTIVRLGAPAAWRARRAVRFEPVRYEGLLVDGEPEAAWLARRAADQVRSYMADRLALATAFAREVAAQCADVRVARVGDGVDALVVRPYLAALNPGFFSHFEHRNAEARMGVQVLQPDETLVDEVQIVAVVVAGEYHPSANERLELAGADLGRRCASFVHDRLRAA